MKRLFLLLVSILVSKSGSAPSQDNSISDSLQKIFSWSLITSLTIIKDIKSSGDEPLKIISNIESSCLHNKRGRLNSWSAPQIFFKKKFYF
ncbi:MAG: hypothetical protein ABI792_07805 [bacterium]